MDSSFRSCKTLKLRSRRKFRMESLHRCNTLKLYNNRRKLPEKDLIGALPDVILVSVLSLLTMKEAGRTSVLSKRWRDVWAYVPLLNFDASKISEELVNCCLPMNVERNKFIRWVDQVVSSHKAPIVDEFRLRFLLGEEHRENIDNWVRFVTEKKVKRLELNFGSAGRSSYFPYTFSSLSFCNSLTSLQLDFVSVIGEVLERLIYNCKALDFLSVTHSRVLLHLKVVSPSLKSLRILYCIKFTSLEISAPNLVSVDYFGAQLFMPFKNTPKLSELFIGNIDKPHLMMSLITHQIEVLKLYIPHIKPFSKVFPNCASVRTLDVYYDPECDKDLFRVSSVIKACPLLHKLVIQLDLHEFSKEGQKLEMKGEEPWCHYNLKIVEIVGFAGSILGFARYLIKNFVSLEKLIIDPQPPFDLRNQSVDNKKIKRAQKQAAKLRSILEPHIKLEIL